MAGLSSPGAPKAPHSVVVTPVEAGLTVSWQETTSGMAPQKYSVELVNSGTSQVTGVWTNPSATTSITISGLDSAVTYSVRVRSERDFKVSEWTEPVTGTPLEGTVNVMQPPINVTVDSNPGGGEIQFHWSPPASGPSPLTYEVRILRPKSNSQDVVVYEGPRSGGLLHIQKGLMEGTLYKLYVRSVGSDGSRSIYSYTTVTTAAAAPVGWATSGTLPGTSKKWDASAYGGGVYVAISGYNNTVNSDLAATSPTGNTWTARTLPTVADWDAVAYGDGVFVAVANNSSAAAYSTDGGATWTASTLPVTAEWADIAYGNGTFVAVAIGNPSIPKESATAYSTDGGATWTASVMPVINLRWSHVAYGGGKFVSIAMLSDTGATSTDGINWTPVTLSGSAPWGAFTYGGGKFVGIGSSSATSISSDDGVTWASSPIPMGPNGPYTWLDVTYANGRFVAVSPNNRAMESTDGVNWTFTGDTPAGNWSSVVTNGTAFVAIPGFSDIVAKYTP